MTTSRNNGTQGRRWVLPFQIVTPLLLWFLFFGAGLTVNTQPYREAIKKECTSTAEKFCSWVVVLTCFTPTNVAILCVFAGLLGASGNKVKLGPDPHKIVGASGNQEKLDTDSHKTDGSDRTHPFLSAITRAFFVYIVLISGTFVLLPEPFPDPTLSGSTTYTESAMRELYIRLAGLVSLFSFVVSYKPKIFVNAFRRIVGE